MAGISAGSAGLPASARNPYLIATVVGIAAFMEVLDISIANVALQHIAGSLSAGQEESTWVLTSYLVANGIVLPMSGWLSDLIGRRRFFILSVGLFSAASFLCGIAPSLELLICARVLQGFGGAGLQPVSQAILSDAFPPEKRGMAFGIYGMAVVAAPAIGPTLGGWITENYSWHWIFLINVPIGMLLIALARVFVSDPPELVEARKTRMARGFKIDYLGLALITLGLGALQIVLDKGQQEDWFDSGFIQLWALFAAIGIVGAVFWELRQKDPIVNLRLLRQRNFGIANGLMFMLGFVLLSTTLLLPQLTQSLLGYNALLAGLVLTPGGMILLVLMPLMGRLVSVIDARLLIGIGCMIVGSSMLYMGTLSLGVDFNTLVWARMFQTAGLAFLFIPINTLAYVGIAPDQSGSASALINLMRNVGGSFGISLTTTLLARGAQAHQVELVDRVTPLDPVYQATMDSLQAATGSEQAAHGAIYQMVVQQATMLSFVDVFHVLAIITFACLLSVFALRKGGGAAPPGAH